MANIKEKAATLLQNCEIVILTSINEKGYPRPVPMSKTKAEGITTIWMATGNSSVKTKDFRLNPKAGICYFSNEDSVALTGEIEIVTDPATKQELWQDWFYAHFTKGPTDPEYVLLKFTAHDATLFVDNEFVHQQI